MPRHPLAPYQSMRYTSRKSLYAITRAAYQRYCVRSALRHLRIAANRMPDTLITMRAISLRGSTYRCSNRAAATSGEPTTALRFVFMVRRTRTSPVRAATSIAIRSCFGSNTGASVCSFWAMAARDRSALIRTRRRLACRRVESRASRLGLRNVTELRARRRAFCRDRFGRPRQPLRAPVPYDDREARGCRRRRLSNGPRRSDHRSQRWRVVHDRIVSASPKRHSCPSFPDFTARFDVTALSRDHGRAFSQENDSVSEQPQ